MRACYVLHQNYLEDSNTQTFSSERSPYLFANLLDKYRRAKFWRTAGFWQISSSDNQIVFRETVGVDLVATVAAGSYSTSESFAAAIAAALDLAGASTYTVSFDSISKKIKLVSNGVGGGGVFQLQLTNALSSGLAAVLGFSTSVNKTGSLTYSADVLRIHSFEFARWDLGMASNPKAFVVTGDRNAPILLSPSSEIYLQANETDNWNDPTVNLRLQFSAQQIVALNGEGLAPHPMRFWRLVIYDRTNTKGYFQLNKAYLGDMYSPDRGAVQFPFESAVIDRTDTIYSENGNSFSNVRPKSDSFILNWDALTIAEKEFLMVIYEKFGKQRPLFFALDANGAFSSSPDFFVRFCQFTAAPRYRLTSPNLFELQMELAENL